MNPFENFDLGSLFSRGLRNLSQAIVAIYYWIIRTSPLPDWVDFLLILVVIGLFVRLLFTWLSPRQ